MTRGFGDRGFLQVRFTIEVLEKLEGTCADHILDRPPEAWHKRFRGFGANFVRIVSIVLT